MPRLTTGRAALIAGAVASLVYANAPLNRWAQDDVALVERNPAAHSVRGALEAWFRPYWPDEGEGTAGLHRPATVLSYAIDWQLSGGKPWWFHLTNVLLHAVAAALVVLVARRWLPPSGSLAAGVVFAVHPVHVEAVANVVGRADVMAAIGMLLAVLAARRYRAAAGSTRRAAWLAAAVSALTLGLFSKEYALVTIVVLALDHWLSREPWRGTGALYAATAAVSLGWFHLWRSIAAAAAEPTVAAALRGLDLSQRLATTLPVQLEVVRLLVWPFALSAGYDPQVIPQRTELGALALFAVVITGAMLILSFRSARRAPAIAFGFLAGAVAYAPASNLLFPSGITLAERTLYASVLVPAMAAGWLWVQSRRKRWGVATGIVLAAALVGFAARTVTRTPFWRDSKTVVVEHYLQHPEDFRAHVRVGRSFEQQGELRSALREYLWAGELFGGDPFVAVHSVRASLALGEAGLALREAQRAWKLMPDNAGISELVVRAYRAMGKADSALSAARVAAHRAPNSLRAARQYARLVEETGGATWLVALSHARVAAIEGRFGAATAELGRVLAALEGEPEASGLCREFLHSRDLIASLSPSLGRRALEIARQEGFDCAGELQTAFADTMSR
ncbi:MAG: tetratricopeptide repeat protein [Gemmatimonadales bacterium]